jgi:hypothetical protein
MERVEMLGVQLKGIRLEHRCDLIGMCQTELPVWLYRCSPRSLLLYVDICSSSKAGSIVSAVEVNGLANVYFSRINTRIESMLDLDIKRSEFSGRVRDPKFRSIK